MSGEISPANLCHHFLNTWIRGTLLLNSVFKLTWNPAPVCIVDTNALDSEAPQILAGHHTRLSVARIVDPDVKHDGLADLEVVLWQRKAKRNTIPPLSHDRLTFSEQFRFVAVRRDCDGWS
ncbi:MAG: hypothetical protein WDM87_10355 [Terracidiphilus sp.]